MVFAPPVARAFFPLDDELALLPGSLTPRLQEACVRLCTHIPSFAKAAAELAWFTGATVHRDSARRLTHQAGALVVAHQTADASRILDQYPPSPPGPDTLLLSVDGAMVPLRKGQWAETRTLVVGAVQPTEPTPDGAVVRTTDLSYFSRLADSTTFTDMALVELHRRGVERAGRVGAVVDGAVWCQSFLDWHYPEALRILDFPHASEYITAIGQTRGPDGELLAAQERMRLCHELKHHGPERVVAELEALVAAHPNLEQLPTQVAYLQKRVAQLQYPTFVAAGWPIGSGMVESANKLVVEARLKGPGMHWEGKNVNPVLALRNAVCNDRWDETWALVEHEHHRQRVSERYAHRKKRAALRSASTVSAAPTSSAATPVAGVPSEPLAPKPPHPWKRAWSVRRQRELADAS
jgi:hypothetical protein